MSTPPLQGPTRNSPGTRLQPAGRKASSALSHLPLVVMVGMIGLAVWQPLSAITSNSGLGPGVVHALGGWPGCVAALAVAAPAACAAHDVTVHRPARSRRGKT